MLKIFIKTTIIILSLIISTTASAAVVSSLYSAQIPVNSHSSSQQNQALTQALNLVLIKVSGNSAITNIDGISGALEDPNQYVRNFSYTKAANNSTMPLLLNVNFTPQAINDLLQQTGQPIWSQNRPLTLIWLVTKNASGLHLINNSSEEQIAQLTNEASTKRGLPIIFPILDLSDIQQIQASDVWAPFINVIQRASARYAPDEILIVRINNSNQENIVSNWTLLSQNKSLNWDIKNKNIEETINNGIDNVVTTLANQFAVTKSNNQQHDLKLLVTDLQSINDYAKITNYLNKLSGVINVEVEKVTASQATFILTLNTDTNSLRRAIKLGSVLLPIQADELQINIPNEDQSAIIEQQTLKYRYNHNS